MTREQQLEAALRDLFNEAAWALDDPQAWSERIDAALAVPPVPREELREKVAIAIARDGLPLGACNCPDCVDACAAVAVAVFLGDNEKEET